MRLGSLVLVAPGSGLDSGRRGIVKVVAGQHTGGPDYKLGGLSTRNGAVALIEPVDGSGEPFGMFVGRLWLVDEP